MMKGLSQQNKNTKWHAKHLTKLAKAKAHRKIRLFRYTEGITREKLVQNRAERQYREAQTRERLMRYGIGGRVKMATRRFINLFNKPANA